MRAILLWAAVAMVANSVLALNYNNYPDYQDSEWNYQRPYSQGCRQYGYQTQSQSRLPTKAFQYQRPQNMNRPLEGQYDKLIIMFTKDNCPYCDYMKPIMKEAENRFGKDIKFLYIDIDQNYQYPNQYGFSTVPHIVYFKGGKKLDAHGSGDKSMTVEQVEKKITTLFP